MERKLAIVYSTPCLLGNRRVLGVVVSDHFYSYFSMPAKATDAAAVRMHKIILRSLIKTEFTA